VRSLARRPDLAISYKPHPRGRPVDIPGAENVARLHIDDAIRAADLVLTFTSGVGLLALVHQKPVAAFGRAYYCQPGVCDAVASVDDVVDFATRGSGRNAPASRERFLAHLLTNVYSSVRFLANPLGAARSRQVAIVYDRIRVWRPSGTVALSAAYPVWLRQPALMAGAEYSAAVSRALRNRLRSDGR
jgi:hypothetical protein